MFIYELFCPQSLYYAAADFGKFAVNMVLKHKGEAAQAAVGLADKRSDGGKKKRYIEL